MGLTELGLENFPWDFGPEPLVEVGVGSRGRFGIGPFGGFFYGGNLKLGDILGLPKRILKGGKKGGNPDQVRRKKNWLGEKKGLGQWGNPLCLGQFRGGRGAKKEGHEGEKIAFNGGGRFNTPLGL